MAAANKYLVYYVDKNGLNVRSQHWIDPATYDPGDLADFTSALEFMTSCKMVKGAINNSATLALGAAIAGPYDAEDKVEVAWIDVNGNTQIVSMPGPKAGIFLPDGKTVDLTHVDFITWRNAAKAVLKGRGGEGFAGTPIWGKRIRRQR